MPLTPSQSGSLARGAGRQIADNVGVPYLNARADETCTKCTRQQFCELLPVTTDARPCPYLAPIAPRAEYPTT